MATTELASLKFNLDEVEKVLRDAIAKGLSTRQLKNEVQKAAVVEIEKAVDKNQNLFRPDAGPGGGDELVGKLGIGQGGRPLDDKYAGPDGAWALLKPGTTSAKLTSSFRRRRTGRFGILNYEIDLAAFFGDFRSTYISRKRGDDDLRISWMQNLIDGIPIAQLRDFAPNTTGHAFIDSGPNFNRALSRTGLGHMVALERLKIPAQQFTFKGRGRANTFGKLISDINRRFASSRFRKKIEKRIAESINSGG